MDVELVRWPGEEDRLSALRQRSTPRLVLVAADAVPPATVDPFEDWVRLPAAEDEVRLRVMVLRRRRLDAARDGAATAPARRDCCSADGACAHHADPPGPEDPASSFLARSLGIGGEPAGDLSRSGTAFGDEEADAAPVLDPDGLLRTGDSWVQLPPVEARLLTALLDRYGAVVSRDSLLRVGWPEGRPDRNVLDARMVRLRRRLAPSGLVIRTIRSRGYLLERSDDQ